MANIMNMVDVSNKPRRSGFDLSKRNCFTAKIGEILPVYRKNVLPGDSWEIDLREFMRTQPVQTATFGRIRQYYDFYFVPFSLLWDKFDAWVMQTKNAYHAKDVLSAADVSQKHPYFTLANLVGRIESLANKGKDYMYFDMPVSPSFDDGQLDDVYTHQCSKLLSYLDYPLVGSVGGSTGLALSPWPLLAYQKIYQDYFRFGQWEDAAPWTYNLDYIMQDSQCEIDTSSYLTSANSNTPLFWNLRYANLDKDLFNGMLPSPQFGDTAIAGPLTYGDNPAARWNSNKSVALKTSVPLQPVADGVSGGFYPIGATGLYAPYRNEGGATPTKTGLYLNGVAPYQGSLALPVDLSESMAGLSILLLRQAEALQKWKEICISGDPDFKEQLEKHWGVKISADNSYRCQYLGGIANNIDVSEVINTNLAGIDDVYQADIKGKGVSASQGKINFKSHQYGIIMCVYHAKPIIEWCASNLLDPQITAVSASDYPIPEFDQIGMQQLLRCNFIYDSPSNWDQPIGYVPRYADYKTDVDVLHGGFDVHANSSAGFAPWVIPHFLSSQQQEYTDITYKAFKVPYNIGDNLFAVAANGSYNSEHLLCSAYFNVKCVRNLDRNGLPY